MAIPGSTPEDTPISPTLPSSRKSLLERPWEPRAMRPLPIPDAFASSSSRREYPSPLDIQDLRNNTDTDIAENHLLSIQNRVVRELAQLRIRTATLEYRRVMLTEAGDEDSELDREERDAEIEERRLIALQTQIYRELETHRERRGENDRHEGRSTLTSRSSQDSAPPAYRYTPNPRTSLSSRRSSGTATERGGEFD